MKTYGTRGKAEPHNSMAYNAYLKKLNLSSEDFNALKKRGLTPEQIKNAGYATKEPYTKSESARVITNLANEIDLKGVPGFWVQEKRGNWTTFIVHGIVIPVRDYDGNIASLLLRNAEPKVDKQSGKIKNKYVSFSSSGKNNGAKVWQTIHCPIIKGTPKESAGTTIRVTEGVLKADVTTAIGDFYTLGLQGLKVTDDFEVILEELEVQEVRICLDQGEDENIDIIRTRAELINRTRKFGIDVVVELWDATEGKGIDDVLAAGKHEKIRAATEDEIESFLELANVKNPENGEWVYVVAIERFVNVFTFQKLKKGQFADKFCMESVDNVNKMIALGFKQVDSLTYMPTGERFVTEENGVVCLNTWQAPKIVPVECDVEKFTNHISYLLPDEYEHNILLDFMAYQVQHPGNKILWCIVLQGKQGVGKSYVWGVMKLLLGKENVSFPTNDQLHENYTDWQKSCQLVVIEEIMAKGRMELMNKLKPIITQDTCQIREMFTPAYTQPNRFNLMMSTNYKDALILEEDDRRYCILETKAAKREIEYYIDLWDWTRETKNTQGVLHYLLKRDLSKFQPFANAPDTDAKKTMISISRTNLEEWIESCVEDEAYPFQCDMVSIRHLKDKNVCPSGFEKLSNFKWAQALQKCGAVQHPQKIELKDKSKSRVWIVRRQNMWLNEPGENIKKQYEKFDLDRLPGNPIEDSMPI